MRNLQGWWGALSLKGRAPSVLSKELLQVQQYP